MIGEYIRSLRASAGLNQRELAERVGISASMLSLVESGKREPTIRMLRDIGRALQIPSAALFVVALHDEPPEGEDSPVYARLRTMGESLLTAVQHSLVVRRMQQVREQD
jgi:transcriptional regulator with XRE-family HTH domain